MILAAPPWQGELHPSIAETEDKAKELIKEITLDDANDEPGALLLEALVDKADRALEERIGVDRIPVEEEIGRLDGRLAELETISAALMTMDSKRNELREAVEACDEVLDGASLDDLRTHEESQRRNAGTVALGHRLGEVAAELMDGSDEMGVTPCPICGTDHERDALSDLISALSKEDGEQIASDLRETEDQLKAALEADGLVHQLKEELRDKENDLNEKVVAFEDEKLADAVVGGSVGDYVESVKEQKASKEKQIGGFEDWLKGVQAKVAKLHEEARFQSIQQNLKSLKAVDEEMQRAERSFEHVVEFGESVRGIRDSVRLTLTKELREKVPSVAKELTAVFSALTRHDYFDQLVIDDEKLPNLELLVASSSDPTGMLHPTGVLNGQAESALALVPHFALSQAEEAPTEVYLVLLDDPTRAFDREHIRILIERLADLGERVQVVVATQENETFRKLLPKCFARESYVIVEPRAWSPIDGPKLVVE